MGNDFLKLLFMHFGKTAGVILGFLLAISLIFLKPLNTLLIICLVVLGFIVGKWIDEGVSIKKFLKNLLDSISENKWRQ
ncbi:MAG TPA: DUF2273 domain-containing protein [Candidatus Goldiibacteriota bacterium]|nr:DUF2273 domain-containing protein [Candidatus Goldiibacteriota bacterium]